MKHKSSVWLIVALASAGLLSTGLLSAVLSSAGLSSAALAEDWPQFRGPGGQGRSSEVGLPLKWTDTENVAWKTEVPGESWSSPIVWGDRVLVTTATDEGKSCRVLALDRKQGSLVWNVEVLQQEPIYRQDRNTNATPTPATDGERICVCFGDGSLAALDFNGRVLWINRDYPFYSQHGLASSLLLYQDVVIQARDGSSAEDKELGWQRPWDQAYILALDVRTGRERWKARRGLSRISHGMPTVWEHDGRVEVVSEAGDVVQGFDVLTGERIWSQEVIGEGKVPSTVIGEGLVFTSGGWGGRESIKAFRLGGQGDLGVSGLVWEQKKGLPKVPSMVYVEPHLFAVTDNGIATCMVAATGKILWQERLGGNYSASPVAAEGRVYFTSDEGLTTVVAASPEFQRLAENRLNEKVQASAAIAQGQIFLRTERHLFAIGTP